MIFSNEWKRNFWFLSISTKLSIFYERMLSVDMNVLKDWSLMMNSKIAAGSLNLPKNTGINALWCLHTIRKLMAWWNEDINFWLMHFAKWLKVVVKNGFSICLQCYELIDPLYVPAQKRRPIFCFAAANPCCLLRWNILPEKFSFGMKFISQLNCWLCAQGSWSAEMLT